LVLGDDEINSDSGKLKKMSDGNEISITLGSLVSEMKRISS
jgi:histidyl-tRNA synthetase